MQSLSTTFRRATGWPYEVVVVMEKDAWQGESGDLLRMQLQASLPALPQSEPTMRVTYVEPAQFDGMLKYMRNILLVSLDADRYTQTRLSMNEDRWAKGQCIISLHAPNEQLLTEYLLLHTETVVDHFNQAERNRWIQALNEDYRLSVEATMRSQFGYPLHVPRDVRVGKVSDQFMWASNNANRGRMDLIAYTFPLHDAGGFQRSLFGGNARFRVAAACARLFPRFLYADGATLWAQLFTDSESGRLLRYA